MVGGDNNVFINNDIINFYEVLFVENLEMVFWLEFDCMMAFNFDEEVLEVQCKVVFEEFKEICFNEFYGDVWYYIVDMAYKVYFYCWLIIGKVFKYVEDVIIEDVKDFFYIYYWLNNVILFVVGNVIIIEVCCLAEKWFGEIFCGLERKW